MKRVTPRTHTFIVSMYVFFTLIIFSVVLLVWSYRFSSTAIDKELKTAFLQRHTTALSIIETQMEIINLSIREILDGPFLMEAVNNKEQARSTNLLIKEMDAFAGYGNLDIIFISYPGHPVWADASFSLFEVQPLLPEIAGLQIPRAGIIYKPPASDLILALKTVPIIHPDTGKVMGKIFGGFVLNDNLDLMELIREKTQSSAVSFFSEGSAIGSTEIETSTVNQLMSNHYETMGPGVTHFNSGIIASYAPLIFNHGATSLQIMFAISDTSYVKLKNSYRNTVLIMFILAVCFSILSAWILKGLISPSLKQLLNYSEMIRAGRTDAVFQKGQIIELNEVGDAMEAMVESLNRANREMDDFKNYLVQILDSMPSILVGIDTHGAVTQWNKGAVDETGMPPAKALGKKLETVFPRLSIEIPRIETAIKKGTPVTALKVEYIKNNAQRFEDITIYPLMEGKMGGAVIRLDDVTDQVKMEEMLIQSEKMLSVGGLAAGMAHEINNPLAGMMQNAQVVLHRITEDIPASLDAAEKAGTTLDTIRAFMKDRGILRQLESIHGAGIRASQIVQNMLSFSRKGDTGKSDHNLTEILDQTLELAQSDYDLKKQYDFKTITIERVYEPDLPLVSCEASKLQQVFFNILKNCAEAMAEETDRDGKAPPKFVLRVFRSGHHLVVEIEDNGPGMDESVRKRIFEPFFTTKQVGIGTGLGLSVSYFIITENHGGQMRVESTLGHGAKFIIYLPVTPIESRA